MLTDLVDPEWYLASYPDVRALGADPVRHFIDHGLADGRNPNGFFHRTWYQETYPEVPASDVSPLLHYLRTGAAALYNPHPRFDAAWYVRQHPEAAPNPLLHHMRIGKARNWPTEPGSTVADYLPSTAAPLRPPSGVAVDIIIPVHDGLPEFQRCIDAVLTDPDRPPGRVIVVDDASPDPALSAWIDQLAAARRIERLRNRQRRGFLGSANRGIAAAGMHDVLVLSSAVVLPPGTVGRLAAQAGAGPRIASVSPLSDSAVLAPAADMDALCRRVNSGRGAAVPVTVLSCMYIRRAAIAEAGAFDEGAFGQESGGEIDFCRRAAERGWRHVLTCDTFVPGLPEPDDAGIAERYPDHASLLARHAVADPSGPFRFAITAAAFRVSGKPVILMVFHGLGGGARKQMMGLVERFASDANFLLLFATDRGVALTAPAVPDHPLFIAAADRLDDLVALLRSAGVTRVHLQHLKGLAYDVRALVHRLGVPFDTTVHDYFAICPQVNLLPWPDAPYCGEPGPAGCNACIAARPADGAAEILAWRRERAWQFLEADRVFCPSEDVRDRLARFGLAGRALVVPHERVVAGPWPLRPRPVRGGKLRIALLGVMANLKGAVAVAGLAELAESAGLEIHIIGPVEGDFPERARGLVSITGPYQEAELGTLIAGVRPHVVWFPSPCPETYSYTLTTAIEAGLPIVATAIGSFPARLAGRPLTWVVGPLLSPSDWLAVFDTVRTALRKPRTGTVPPRPAVVDYYADHYLSAATAGIADLRRPGRISVVVIPERQDNGLPSAAAYQRLLQPLDHMARGEPNRFDWMLADAETALRCRVDVILTHRNAVADPALADELVRHARKVGSTLVYDLDENLSGPPGLLTLADRVFVSTPSLVPIRSAGVTVVPDGLDERLWCAQPRPAPSHDGVVRILLLGDDIHEAGIPLVMPALARIRQVHGGWAAFSWAGPTSATGLPPWLQVLEMPDSARASYPGLVQWLTGQPGWDIGLAPVADGVGDASKARVRVLEYAALKLAVLASDMPALHASLAKGPGGMLVGPSASDWYASIDWLIRNPVLRRGLGDAAWQAFQGTGTLASQDAIRRVAWDGLGLPCNMTEARPGRGRGGLTRIRRGDRA